MNPVRQQNLGAELIHSVLIIGSNRFESLESSYARAFRKLDWDVQFWDPMQALYSVSRGYWFGKLFSTFVNVEPWLRKANLQLINLARKIRPDIILVIGTHGVRAGSLGQLRAHLPSTILYCVFPDTPHNLVPDRIQCLPLFDRVFSVSPSWVDVFKRLGISNSYFLPLAADPDLHYPVSNNQSAAISSHDVAFVGNWRLDREDFLEQLIDFDVCIWGSDYWRRNTKSNSKLRGLWGGKPLVGEEFAMACAKNKVMLNLIDGIGWPGPNMRVFEQPACRAFSLVTRTPAILEIFKEGETIECFDSVEEAREKIRYYLTNEDARHRIAEASYRFVIEMGHTYMDRVLQLVRWAEEDGLEL